MHSTCLVFLFFLLLLANPASTHRQHVYLNCSQFIPLPFHQNISQTARHSGETAFTPAFAATNETSPEEVSTEIAKQLPPESTTGLSNHSRTQSSQKESTDPRLAPALYECFRANRYNPMFFPVPPNRQFKPIGSPVFA